MEELDDIERVLDHTETWKLTDSERDQHWQAFWKFHYYPGDMPSYLRELEVAAVKKYQEWLASQCGPNPCEGCCYKKPYVNRKGCAAEDQGECTKPLEWRTQQAGLAQGMQEIAERIKPILDAVCSIENQPHQWMGHPEELLEAWQEMGKMEAKRPGDASPNWSASLPPSSPYPERGQGG